SVILSNLNEENSNTSNITIFQPYTYRNEINQFIMNNPAPTSQHNQSTGSLLAFPFWRPSPMLKKLLNQFETNILHDHPHIPC
ncbi:6_t:CDS:1, partial [Gigaspora rosea]